MTRPREAGPAGEPLDLGAIPHARGFWRRARGLIGVDAERVRSGLCIPRCGSVHTFGMRHSIDVVFVDGAGAIVDVRAAVPPGRFLRGPADARDVIELAAGEADRQGLQKGTRVRWTAC